ncbi:hypothetical protein L9F63_015654 [Diploptera punctata]|uniref:Uncharacterized protein n=1 Tax=Diploptera punctata TaxID=6984 RepID=A0AAD8A6I6_DIPPU|nr:hypothetical protein L9F63_015654 [Diploptera punctata]
MSFDECWDDNSTEMTTDYIDPGTNFGRGRGFIPAEQTSVFGNDHIGFKNSDTPITKNKTGSNFEFRGKRSGRGWAENRGSSVRGRGGRGGRGGFLHDSSDIQNRRSEGRGSAHKAIDNSSSGGGRGRRGKQNG